MTGAVDLWGAKVGNPTAIRTDNGPLPSVAIGEAEQGYHEVVPPYQDIVLDLVLLDGDICLRDEDKEIVSKYSREKSDIEEGNTIYFPLGSGHPYRIDKITTVYEEWHEISFELTITKQTAMSILLKYLNKGATITSVAALITAIPELGGAATIADAITILDGCAINKWGVQDRILLLAIASKKIEYKTKYLVE